MLEEADIQRCFASEYVTARQQFLDRAERMDLIVESVPISKKDLMTKFCRPIISGLDPKMRKN